MTKFSSFREFYPFYLSEHQNRLCRRFHFIGTSLVLCLVILALVTGRFRWLWLVPAAGYGFAWIGTSSLRRTGPRPLHILSTALSEIGSCTGTR